MLVVEEPPERILKIENTLLCHVFAVSAMPITSLQENRRRLLDYLTRTPGSRLADFAYTTMARRVYECLRVAYPAKSTRKLVKLLRTDVFEEISTDPKTKPPPMMNVVSAFTGQGSQYAGMGKKLNKHSSTFSCWPRSRRDSEVSIVVLGLHMDQY